MPNLRHHHTTFYVAEENYVPGVPLEEAPGAVDLAHVAAWMAVTEREERQGKRGTWITYAGTTGLVRISTEPAAFALAMGAYAERADAPRDLYRKPQ